MPRWIYSLLLYLLLPLVPLKLLWRGLRQPEYLRHWGERFGLGFPPVAPGPLIWLHCVSVGETRAAAPLVGALRQNYPDYKILLTHTTPTGRATSEQLFGNNVLRCYLPYDLPFAVRRFLRHFRPQLGALMETELWFNLIAACDKQAIPLLLVNARLSERSARGYARLGHFAANGLNALAAIAAQTEADAVRLRQLGAANVSVMGNLKFDVTPPPEAGEQGATLRATWGKPRPVFLAASTREGEEALVLEAVAAAHVPDLLTVIVPRHPQRFDEVAELLDKRAIRYVRRSANVPPTADCQVVLGDSMGEMYVYYAACDIAFIGGSLLPFGGQNLIEACAMGKPVLIGPHMFNFEQATRLALEAGAAWQVENAAALKDAIGELLIDASVRARMSANARAFTHAQRGCTEKLMRLIGTWL